MSTPNSTIKICSGVLLNKDYKHTIYFDSASAQQNYFAGKVVKTFSAYSYLRKTWDLNVEATMEQARTWSYLYFRNGTGKYYYYFINNLEYVNDSMVKLTLELDVMQTYMFDYTLHACFVEREHSASDELNEHTLEEGLDVGEFYDSGVTHVPLGDLCVLVMTTFENEKVDGSYVRAKGTWFNNTYSGLAVYAVEKKNLAGLNLWLQLWEQDGVSEGVITMWMYPKKLIKLADGHSWDNTQDTIFKRVAGIEEYDLTMTFPLLFNSGRGTNGYTYTPHNKKLYSYPYQYLYITNNAGGSAVYKPELFYNRAAIGDAVTFTVTGAIGAESSVRIVPTYYRKPGANFEEGITLGSYPTCAWNQDAYKLWLAQNQHQLAYSQNMAGLTIAGGGIAATASLLTGNISGVMGGGSSMVSGATQIAGLMAQKADKAIQPPNAKGAYSASINLTNGYQTFSISRRTIDAAHARAIDEYFTMYGYACRRVKVPNRNVRKYWTYTKTVGCHVSGNLCNEDLVKIQSVYDAGVTFWKDGDLIGDYGNPDYDGGTAPALKYNEIT